MKPMKIFLTLKQLSTSTGMTDLLHLLQSNSEEQQDILNTHSRTLF